MVMYFRPIVALCGIIEEKTQKVDGKGDKRGLLQIICAMIMSAGDEGMCGMNHFLTARCQGSAGGSCVSAYAGPCVCMRAGNEAGERQARGKSLSGGIKALPRW